MRLAKTLYPSSRWFCFLLIGLLLLGACKKSIKDEPAPTASNPGLGGYTIDNLNRKITIKMQGADNAEYRGTQKLRIQAPNKDAPLNMLVVSTIGFVDVGSNVKLSIGIALVELYKDDGKYALAPNIAFSPGASPDPNNPATLSSNSRVTFYADNSSGPERTLRAYDTLTKPCPIVIKNKGKAGEVHCPEIRSVEKTIVSFDMTWRE